MPWTTEAMQALIAKVSKKRPLEMPLELVITQAVDRGHMRRIKPDGNYYGRWFGFPMVERIFINEDDWMEFLQARESCEWKPATPNIKATFMGVPVVFDPTCKTGREFP